MLSITSNTTPWLRELRHKYTKNYHFGGPWVRIQARIENMSQIFFCADFSTFSYWKLASDTFGGVHKQYGPKRERGSLFYPMYVITWFIVTCTPTFTQSPKIYSMG